MGNQVSGLKALKAEHVDYFRLILFCTARIGQDLDHWLANGWPWFSWILLIHFIGEHILHMSLPMIPRSLWGITENGMKSLFDVPRVSGTHCPAVRGLEVGRIHKSHRSWESFIPQDDSRCEHPWLFNSPLISYWYIYIYWYPPSCPTYHGIPCVLWKLSHWIPWWGIPCCYPTDPGDFAAWLHRAPAEVRATESGLGSAHGNTWETMRSNYVQLLIFAMWHDVAYYTLSSTLLGILEYSRSKVSALQGSQLPCQP